MSSNFNIDNEEWHIADGLLLHYRGNSKKVVIPNGTIALHWSSFNNNETVEELEFPESVMEIQSVSCKNSNIKRLILPKSLKRIYTEAFACNYFSMIFIPDLPNLEYIAKTIFNNTLINKLYISFFTLVKIYAFLPMENIKELHVKYNKAEIPNLKSDFCKMVHCRQNIKIYLYGANLYERQISKSWFKSHIIDCPNARFFRKDKFFRYNGYDNLPQIDNFEINKIIKEIKELIKNFPIDYQNKINAEVNAIIRKYCEKIEQMKIDLNLDKADSISLNLEADNPTCLEAAITIELNSILYRVKNRKTANLLLEELNILRDYFNLPKGVPKKLFTNQDKVQFILDVMFKTEEREIDIELSELLGYYQNLVEKFIVNSDCFNVDIDRTKIELGAKLDALVIKARKHYEYNLILKGESENISSKTIKDIKMIINYLEGFSKIYFQNKFRDIEIKYKNLDLSKSIEDIETILSQDLNELLREILAYKSLGDNEIKLDIDKKETLNYLNSICEKDAIPLEYKSNNCFIALVREILELAKKLNSEEFLSVRNQLYDILNDKLVYKPYTDYLNCNVLDFSSDFLNKRCELLKMLYMEKFILISYLDKMMQQEKLKRVLNTK